MSSARSYQSWKGRPRTTIVSQSSIIVVFEEAVDHLFEGHCSGACGTHIQYDRSTVRLVVDSTGGSKNRTCFIVGAGCGTPNPRAIRKCSQVNIVFAYKAGLVTRSTAQRCHRCAGHPPVDAEIKTVESTSERKSLTRTACVYFSWLSTRARCNQWWNGSSNSLPPIPTVKSQRERREKHYSGQEGQMVHN